MSWPGCAYFIAFPIQNTELRCHTLKTISFSVCTNVGSCTVRLIHTLKTISFSVCTNVGSCAVRLMERKSSSTSTCRPKSSTYWPMMYLANSGNSFVMSTSFSLWSSCASEHGTVCALTTLNIVLAVGCLRRRRSMSIIGLAYGSYHASQRLWMDGRVDTFRGLGCAAALFTRSTVARRMLIQIWLMDLCSKWPVSGRLHSGECEGLQQVCRKARLRPIGSSTCKICTSSFFNRMPSRLWGKLLWNEGISDFLQSREP